MAPEQARGEVDRIDERADVFALGSILCEILTGAPAFTGESASEILEKAVRMEIGDALSRLGSCAADAELVELARGCLSALAADRPPDAHAVSDRVTAHFISVPEKLRQAELARVAEQARSRLAIVAGAAAIVLVASAGGGLWWAQAQQAKRMARTTQSVNEALAEAAQFAGEAEAGGERGDASRWTQAVSAAKQAEALLAQGDADPVLWRTVVQRVAELTDRRDAFETDRRLIAALEAARGGASESVGWAEMDAAYGSAFRAAGLDVDATDAATAGAWIRTRSAPWSSPRCWTPGPMSGAGPAGLRPIGAGSWGQPGRPIPSRGATPYDRRPRSRATTPRSRPFTLWPTTPNGSTHSRRRAWSCSPRSSMRRGIGDVPRPSCAGLGPGFRTTFGSTSGWRRHRDWAGAGQTTSSPARPRPYAT